MHIHTPREIQRIETDGLRLAGWLNMGGWLVPVLLRTHHSHEERRHVRGLHPLEH